MGRMSDSTKLLALGLLNLADDEGYFFADPVTVRNALRPFDDSSVTTQGALTELSGIGYVDIKEHAPHGKIGFIPGFTSHQVVNRPKPSTIKRLYESGKDHGSITDDSVNNHGGREGNGKEGNDSPKLSPKVPSPPSRIVLIDDEHIRELKTLYVARDVDKAVADMRAWLLGPKGRGKQPTKRRLQTFLRDAEPLGPTAPKPKAAERIDRSTIDTALFAEWAALAHEEPMTVETAPEEELRKFLTNGKDDLAKYRPA